LLGKAGGYLQIRVPVFGAHVWIKVTADPQSPDSISAVTYQVRTKYRNPDLQIAASLAEQTTLALIRAENPPTTP
jgi:hypothetical protein